MAVNFITSFNEQIKHWFSSRTSKYDLRTLFSTVGKHWWRTLPSYLPAYVFIFVAVYASWYGVRPATTIAPFHAPSVSQERSLPFSGEAVVDTLQGAITSIHQEAAGLGTPPPCDFVRQKELEFGGLRVETGGTFQVRGPVTVEVKGISPEALKSAARQVFGTERSISGSVLLTAPDSFILFAQASDAGPWSTKPQKISVDGLRVASCELAEDILGATNNNLLAAAWNHRQQFDRVLSLYPHLPMMGIHFTQVPRIGCGLGTSPLSRTR